MQSFAKNGSRTEKSTNNIVTGFLSQLVILVLNFAVRFIFIQSLGYNYLGINSLFTSILTILSVADLGFGSALGIVLYSSLAKKKEEEIAGLMNFFKKAYFIIGLVVVVIGLIVTPFVKFLVNTNDNIPLLPLYFLFFLANTVSSYFISYRSILIKADQRNSVVNNITTVVKIAKALLEVFVLFFFPNWFGLDVTYFSYLGIMVVATYAIGCLTSLYAKKKYPFAFNKTKISEDKKKDIVSTTRDLFIYKICSALSSPIDAILISLFVGTALLGVYSNYLLIFTTLLEFICLISRNIISSVGNFVVEKSIEEQKKLYFEIQAIYFAIIIFCTINFVSLASPFINLVFHSESVLSNWVVYLFGLTLIIKCAGELSIIFRETTKTYKKTKIISLVYTIDHIGLSIAFGYLFGLEGILLGNVVAYFITSFWFEVFALFKWHFRENVTKALLLFAYVIIITAGASFGGYYVCNNIIGTGIDNFVLACVTSLGISLVTLACLIPLSGFRKVFNRVIGVVTKGFELFYSKRIIQKILFIAYFVVIVILIVLRDFVALDINKFIFMAVFIVFLILNKKENAMIIILFTLPFSTSLAELYIQLFALIYLFIVNIRKNNWKRWLIVFSVPLFLFGYEMIISSFYGGSSLEVAFRIFALLSILGIIFYDRSEFNKKHLFAFIGGCLFTLAIIAVHWLMVAFFAINYSGPVREKPDWDMLFRAVRLGKSAAEWLSKYIHIEYPVVPTKQIIEDPNNIGLMSIVCLASISAVFYTCRRKERILLIIFSVFLIIFGLWSQSRMFVISLVMLLIINFIFFGTTKVFRWSSIGLTFGIICILFLSFYCFQTEVFEQIFGRFSLESFFTAGGRIKLLQEYLSFTFSDWKYALFGIGVHNLRSFTGFEDVPHVNAVQFISAYGIVLFVIFISFIAFMWIRSKDLIKPNKPKILLILPLLMAVIFTFSIQLFIPSIILICFIPGILCVSYLNKNNEKKLWDKAVVNRGEKIKIVICSTSFSGGMGTYIKNIVPYLLGNNFEVALIFNPDTSNSEKQRFESLDCKKYVFNKKISKAKVVHLLRKHRYYEKTIDEFKPDIIYINTSSFARSKIIYNVANSYYYAQIIMHSHNAVNNETKMTMFEKWLRYNMILENANRYSCSKESGKVFFGKNFGRRTADSVINNFVDVENFKFDLEKRNEIRKQYEVKDDEILLGSIGRLSEQKNQRFLIELLERLPNNYKLMIVGGGSLQTSLDQQIIDLKLENRAIIVPSNNEVNKYLCAFDYFCLSSLTEGLPFVSVEAQCSGVMNIINKDLPKEIALTDNVTVLPLTLCVWQSYLIKNQPVPLNNRLEASKQIVKADFSSKTVPETIARKLQEKVYG